MLNPINKIVLMLFKIIFKRPNTLTWFTRFISLPSATIGLHVIYKVFRTFFSSTNSLISTLAFIPVFHVLYSIRNLIPGSLNINQLRLLYTQLNTYVIQLVSELITHYWETYLK